VVVSFFFRIIGFCCSCIVHVLIWFYLQVLKDMVAPVHHVPIMDLSSTRLETTMLSTWKQASVEVRDILSKTATDTNSLQIDAVASAIGVVTGHLAAGKVVVPCHIWPKKKWSSKALTQARQGFNRALFRWSGGTKPLVCVQSSAGNAVGTVSRVTTLTSYGVNPKFMSTVVQRQSKGSNSDSKPVIPKKCSCKSCAALVARNCGKRPQPVRVLHTHRGRGRGSGAMSTLVPFVQQ
jgi:hypothetical protein